MKHRKLNKRTSPHFVQLFVYMLDSAAYLSLGCAARAVLVEFGRIYDGSNNGRLGMSIRTLARRCNIANNTAGKALKELQDRGFIECVQVGAFRWKVRHASEWRVTMWPCNVSGAIATKAYMNWGKQNQKPVSNDQSTVSNQDQLPLQEAA
jgi:DNA-binding transcriptional regulator YhcF (GntR family)